MTFILNSSLKNTSKKYRVRLIVIDQSKNLKLRMKKLKDKIRIKVLIKKLIKNKNKFIKITKNRCCFIIRNCRTIVVVIVVSITLFFGKPVFANDYQLPFYNFYSPKPSLENVILSYDNQNTILKEQNTVENENIQTIEIFKQRIPVSKKEESTLDKYKKPPMSLNKLDKRDNYEKELYIKHQGSKFVTTYNIIQAESVATFLQNLEIEEKKAVVQSPARQKFSGRKLKESEMEARERHLYEELKKQANDNLPTLDDLDD